MCTLGQQLRRSFNFLGIDRDKHISKPCVCLVEVVRKSVIKRKIKYRTAEKYRLELQNSREENEEQPSRTTAQKVHLIPVTADVNAALKDPLTLVGDAATIRW